MKQNNKAEKHLCSICGKEYEGYGNNAQPVNNSKCCNECNYSVVIPIRIYTNCLQEIINNGESEVFEVKSKSYADVTYYYIKGKQVITDFKKMFVRDITLKKLKSTIKKLDALYGYTYLLCDYNYMSNLYKEQI